MTEATILEGYVIEGYVIEGYVIERDADTVTVFWSDKSDPTDQGEVATLERKLILPESVCAAMTAGVAFFATVTAAAITFEIRPRPKLTKEQKAIIAREADLIYDALYNRRETP